MFVSTLVALTVKLYAAADEYRLLIVPLSFFDTQFQAVLAYLDAI
jgi:hypothetical protein